MTKNMGTYDRVIRIIISVIIAILYFTEMITGTTGIVLLILSIILLATGLVGVCPLYMPFDLSTRKIEK